MKKTIKKMRVLATTVILSVVLAFNSFAEDTAVAPVEAVVAVDHTADSNDEAVSTTSNTATDSRDKDGCDVDTFFDIPEEPETQPETQPETEPETQPETEPETQPEQPADKQPEKPTPSVRHHHTYTESVRVIPTYIPEEEDEEEELKYDEVFPSIVWMDSAVIDDGIPEIPYAPAPVGGLPKTGDESSSLPMVTFLLSLLGIVILMLTEKKEKADTTETRVSRSTAKVAAKAAGNNMRSFGIANIRSRKEGGAGLSCMPVR